MMLGTTNIKNTSREFTLNKSDTIRKLRTVAIFVVSDLRVMFYIQSTEKLTDSLGKKFDLPISSDSLIQIHKTES